MDKFPNPESNELHPDGGWETDDETHSIINPEIKKKLSSRATEMMTAKDVVEDRILDRIDAERDGTPDGDLKEYLEELEEERDPDEILADRAEAIEKRDLDEAYNEEAEREAGLVKAGRADDMSTHHAQEILPNKIGVRKEVESKVGPYNVRASRRPRKEDFSRVKNIKASKRTKNTDQGRAA